MPGNVLLRNHFALHPVGVNILVAPYSGAFHATRCYRKSGGVERIISAPTGCGSVPTLATDNA